MPSFLIVGTSLPALIVLVIAADRFVAVLAPAKYRMYVGPRFKLSSLPVLLVLQLVLCMVYTKREKHGHQVAPALTELRRDILPSWVYDLLHQETMSIVYQGPTMACTRSLLRGQEVKGLVKLILGVFDRK